MMMPATLAARALAVLLPLFATSARAQSNLGADPTTDPAMAALAIELEPEAARQKVAANTVRRAFAGLTRDPEIAPLLERQPENERSVGGYVDALVSPTRIETGQAMRAQHADLLTAIEGKHGVDRHAVLAIWGVESNYGTAPGTRNVIRSLATLDARRPAPAAVLAHRAGARLAHPAARRHRARRDARVMGRRHGPHPVHAVDVQSPRRRSRR